MTGEPVLLRYCSALAVLALFAPLLLLSTAARTPAEQARPEKIVGLSAPIRKVSKGIYRCELDLATASCPTVGGCRGCQPLVPRHPSQSPFPLYRYRNQRLRGKKPAP